ncbi:response regulator [Tautonia plasticadhaerens]|uniref:DNA-binding response regulator MtrA n=1 Tax=Tautonia plasticadhaerens TaxID=2527974 RepID=A0A518HBM5_9BACT|nr:response regulator [Tautonia plasticadhaerens]QDV38217.1 DNA-binding response regulator MtrA [Tautonia plasticadhaerens]
MNDLDGPAPARRVLIVDDSVDTTRMMRVLLKGEGFQVLAATDGAEALAAARDFRPDVVLLDLTMPGMTGQEVAEALRNGGDTAGAQIIAVSGYGVQGVPPGFDHLLVKPVDFEALLNLIGPPERRIGLLPDPFASLA